MFDIFTSDIAVTIKECAPQKTFFIRNDKPKLNYGDDKFISQLFNSKKNEHKKRSIISDTRNSKKSSNLIPLLRNTFGDFITNNLQIANPLNCKFSTLGCFHEKISKIRQSPPTSTCNIKKIINFHSDSSHQLNVKKTHSLKLSKGTRSIQNPSLGIEGWLQ